jgi:hypothetical protein
MFTGKRQPVHARRRRARPAQPVPSLPTLGRTPRFRQFRQYCASTAPTMPVVEHQAKVTGPTRCEEPRRQGGVPACAICRDVRCDHPEADKLGVRCANRGPGRLMPCRGGCLADAGLGGRRTGRTPDWADAGLGGRRTGRTPDWADAGLGGRRTGRSARSWPSPRRGVGSSACGTSTSVECGSR